MQWQFYNTLRSYNWSSFASDATAGLTVGIILIPQSIAYALLMGVPAIYGLYSSLVPLLIYALFGSAPQLNVGPVAVVSMLILAGLHKLAAPFSPTYIGLVISSGFLIGIFQIMMGILRVGFLVNLISQPVISGFVSAVALLIIFSQFEDALGLVVPKELHGFQILVYACTHLSDCHVFTILIFVLSSLFIIGLKKWNPRAPGQILVLVICTLLSYFLGWESQGISIVGNIPEGLPQFQLPDLNYETCIALFPTAATLACIGFVGSIGIAKSFEIQSKDHTVYPNTELIALGASKLIGSCFMAIPTSVSYSRSAINRESGAKTTISSILAAIIIIVSLLFFTSIWYHLPKSILSAMIITSVLGLINYKDAVQLLRVKRSDFLVLLTTFFATLIFGATQGILIGAAGSFIFLHYRSTRPHIAELVNIPNTDYYKNLNRFPNAVKDSRYLILRFDDQLYFANANFFKEALRAAIQKRTNFPAYFILDMSSVHGIDSSGILALEDCFLYLQDNKIQLLLVGTIGPVRDLLKRANVTRLIGIDSFFVSLQDAISRIETGDYNPQITKKVAAQFNAKRSFLD